MTEHSRKSRKSHGYRLAVPMSDETQAHVDEWARRCNCSQTEAARVLLEWGAAQAIQQARKQTSG